MIEQHLLKYLTSEQQTELRMYEQGFESDFWKAVKRLLEIGKDQSVQRMIDADTWPENRFQKGAAAAYNDVLQAEDRLVNLFTQRATEAMQVADQAAVDAELDYE